MPVFLVTIVNRDSNREVSYLMEAGNARAARRQAINSLVNVTAREATEEDIAQVKAAGGHLYRDMR